MKEWAIRLGLDYSSFSARIRRGRPIRSKKGKLLVFQKVDGKPEASEPAAGPANPHPGDVLREDYPEPLGMTPYRLARGLRMPQTAVGEILAGKCSITPATALKLSRFFGSSAEFWLGLQAAYDLEEERRRLAGQLAQIEPCDLDEAWRERQRAMEARRAVLSRQLAETRPQLEAELAEIEPYDTATEAVAAA